MTQVSLDTSFLISFADPDREHHAVALEYFRFCSAERIPMWISTIAAGEFEVGQPISDLPLQNFRIQPPSRHPGGGAVSRSARGARRGPASDHY